MTERQKKIAIISAVALIAVFLLLKMKAGTVVNQAGDNVTNEFGGIGGISLPPRGAISIPGITYNGAAPEFSAISACCSDCAGSAPRTSYAPAVQGPTYVYNAASPGPNVINYISGFFGLGPLGSKPQVVARNY